MNDELSERAKLRERFAVAIAGGPYALGDKACPTAVEHLRRAWILNEAQRLTDEAMKRREEDNTKALATGAEALPGEYEPGHDWDCDNPSERVTR